MLDQQKDAIQNLIVRALAALDVADVVPQLEKPKDPTHGDVACTVAMQLARRLKQNPRAIAAETLEKADNFHENDGKCLQHQPL